MVGEGGPRHYRPTMGYYTFQTEIPFVSDPTLHLLIALVCPLTRGLSNYNAHCILLVVWSLALRWQGPLMPDLPQVSLFIIYQNIKRFSIGSCNKILNR